MFLSESAKLRKEKGAWPTHQERIKIGGGRAYHAHIPCPIIKQGWVLVLEDFLIKLFFYDLTKKVKLIISNIMIYQNMLI